MVLQEPTLSPPQRRSSRGRQGLERAEGRLTSRPLRVRARGQQKKCGEASCYFTLFVLKKYFFFQEGSPPLSLQLFFLLFYLSFPFFWSSRPFFVASFSPFEPRWSRTMQRSRPTNGGEQHLGSSFLASVCVLCQTGKSTYDLPGLAVAGQARWGPGSPHPRLPRIRK